jgi:hypothetical protein
MVDFNNETTIGKPPKEIVALIILEKLYNYLEADEEYIKKRLGGAAWPLATVRARLRTLFLIAYPMLKRRLEPAAFEKVRKLCEDTASPVKPTEREILEAFQIISNVLDALGLTKLDDRPVFNRARVEEANAAQGYG